MERGLDIRYIPGTILKLDKMDKALGMEFLNKVFYITDGIMLAQIREITGIDGTTLQNWVKRGWVSNPKNKTYDKNQLARIMIINMMRNTMQLSRVAFMMTYVSGTDASDKIVTESLLYDYICRIIVKIASPESSGLNSLSELIDEVLFDYSEPIGGAKRRLSRTLQVIVIAYYSAMIKAAADEIIDSLIDDADKKY